MNEHIEYLCREKHLHRSYRSDLEAADEIERLERERDEARAEVEKYKEMWETESDLTDRVHDENERLRKAIEDAPHDVTCTWDDDERRQLGRKQYCDCWKRDALGEENHE